MIVLDTSAIMAIALAEEAGPACLDALVRAGGSSISAGTLAECYIVATGKKASDSVQAVLANARPTVIPINAAFAARVGAAYANWGKGFHKAKLNFGDCFAYVLARDLDCPLLFIGNDFSRTDVVSALASAAKPLP